MENYPKYLREGEVAMLSIRNLKKTFNIGTENEINIFDGFNLDVEEASVVALLGSNGCGKSTLMNLISGSLTQEEGSINLNGVDISKEKEYKRAEKIAKVHQDPTAGVSPALTILENMSLAMKKGERSKLKMLVHRNNVQHFKELLKPLELNLENKMDVKAKFLSGGQRQALSLILSTLKKPEVLLLDEHTAALDPKTSRLIMEKTIDIAREQKITTIMISHNLRDALKYSDRLIMLHKGKIILDVKPDEVTEQELVDIFNKEQ